MKKYNRRHKCQWKICKSKYEKSNYHLFSARINLGYNLQEWQVISVTAVVFSWQETGKLLCILLCVFVCAHLDICTSLCPFTTYLCWLASRCLVKQNKKGLNRPSAFWTVSIATACCLMCPTHVWTRDDFPPWANSLNITLLEKRSSRQNPAWMVFVCLQCLLVSDKLCLYLWFQ